MDQYGMMAREGLDYRPSRGVFLYKYNFGYNGYFIIYELYRRLNLRLRDACHIHFTTRFISLLSSLNGNKE